MIKIIKKLRLKPGDILVVSDFETCKKLIKVHLKEINFSVPIIFAPNGIKRVNRKYLQKVLDTMNQGNVNLNLEEKI